MKNIKIDFEGYINEFVIDENEIRLIDRKFNLISWISQHIMLTIVFGSIEIYFIIRIGFYQVMNEEYGGLFPVITGCLGLIIVVILIIASFYAKYELTIKDGLFERQITVFNRNFSTIRRNIYFIKIEKSNWRYEIIAKFGYAYDNQTTMISFKSKDIKDAKILISKLKEEYEIENNTSLVI